MSSAMPMMMSPTMMNTFPLMLMTMTLYRLMRCWWLWQFPDPWWWWWLQLWPGPQPPDACYERGGWRGGSCAQRGSLDTEGENLLQVEMVNVSMMVMRMKMTRMLILWMQIQRMFSRWKERFCILTRDYLQVLPYKSALLQSLPFHLCVAVFQEGFHTADRDGGIPL